MFVDAYIDFIWFAGLVILCLIREISRAEQAVVKVARWESLRIKTALAL